MLPRFAKRALLLYSQRHNLPRARTVDLALQYCQCAHVEGDYFEFGVFAGKTFTYAFRSAQLKGLTDMRFHAFDSFQGFSDVSRDDNIGVVAKGDRNYAQTDFMRNIQKGGVDLSRITVTAGWFENTLEGPGQSATNKTLGDRKAAIAYLDADLFEPTLSALRFITDRLVDGSVLIFDNWFLFRGHPSRGERKAFTIWSNENPNLVLTPYHKVGWHGDSFIVNRAE